MVRTARFQCVNPGPIPGGAIFKNMQKIIDLRKQNNSAAVKKQKITLKAGLKTISKPYAQAAAMPAVLPAQKPAAFAPEIKKTVLVPAPKPQEAARAETPQSERREYLAPLFSWSAEEQSLTDEERRGRNIVIIGGAALLVLAALWWGNILFAIFIALAAFVLYASGNGKQKTVKCAVTPQGVKIESRVYEFSDIRSFWIFYDPADIKELSLESKKTMMPQIRAPLGNADPVKLRELLLKFLPEKKHEESLADIIGRKFFG